MKDAHRLLIGSVGDDIHSVGMALLTIAFRETGYAVRNLGILNDLGDFFRAAPDYDVIMISCNNGHADLYLEDFDHQLAVYRLADQSPKLWYLGGCLSVSGDVDIVRKRYLRMGFDFVAPKPIPFEQILGQVERDLELRHVPHRSASKQIENRMPLITGLDEINDDPLSDEKFAAIRTDVLESWKTGSEVLTTDAKRNHADPTKNLHSLIVERMKGDQSPLLQPRTGVAHVADEIDILQFLRRHGLDVSSIQLDAASRKCMYAQAEEGVRRTERGKPSFLNGYPVPVHGVRGVEEIVHAIETPFQIRAGSPDHRLTYEIALAGGATSLEGGFLCYLLPYDKSLSPVHNLANWKYVDKLTGNYDRDNDIVINREYFGPLTTSLIEPTIPICINIVQALLSARSGVRCMSVGLAEQGNRIQDIAGIKVLSMATRHYLDRYGFSETTVSTVYHQYMAGFPTDPEIARQVIVNSSTTGALAGATRIMVKTPVESYKIPSKEDNGEALELTRKGVKQAGDAKIDHKKLQLEIDRLSRQVTGIMSRIEQLGRGSLARGAILAFQTGVLDVPFSPSIYNPGKLLTARDCDGAVRFINPEHLPFDTDIIDFHLDRIEARKSLERLSRASQLLARDLTRIGKSDFSAWPLDGTYVV